MTNEMMEQHTNQGEIVMYQPDETIRLEVRLENDTVWLTQAQMAELFQKDQSVIARHIANVFREGELQETSNMQILHNTLSKFKPTKVYIPHSQRGTLSLWCFIQRPRQASVCLRTYGN
jgi:hypothetical protein